MWTETIWIVLGGLALYIIGTLFVSYLQSRRKPEKKVTPLVKDFWDDLIEEKSKVNPASREYQNSSTKKSADKRKEEYHQKNPAVKKPYPVQHIKSSTKNTRRSENSRPIDNIAVVHNPILDDSPSDDSHNSNSSSHSTSSFGHGGTFVGGGAAASWANEGSASSSSSYNYSDHSSHDSGSSSSDSGSSDCGGGDGGGGD